MSISKRFKRESTSFECLPNELFVEIFGYLNGVDTIYAFSQLNIRFQYLLNDYVKIFDFQFVSKAKFTDILQRHYLDQCRSLRLSNDDKTPGQIELFCQLFSLAHDFSQIEYLSALNMSHTYAEKFLREIQSLQNLTSLTIDTLCGFDIQAFALPSLKQLIFSGCRHTHWLMNFENLESLNFTVKYTCSHTYQFLLPVTLKYLKILSLYTNDLDIIRSQLSSLSKLNTLALHTCTSYSSMPNGRIWEDLIVAHLPLLNIFQFCFPFDCHQHTVDDLNHVIDSYSTPFYLIDKRWFIRCDRNAQYLNSGVLYSLPYAFSHMAINILSFDTSLSTLPILNFDETKSKYYQRIQTLTFNEGCKMPHLGFLSNNIQYLILTVKLPLTWHYIFSQVRHLTLTSHVRMSSNDFEDILRHTPKLDSLKITSNKLRNLTEKFSNSTICQYLSERIRSLTIVHDYMDSPSLGYVSVRLLISIVRLFSLRCEHLSLGLAAHPNTVRPILRRMRNLHSLHVEWRYLSIGADDSVINWLDQQSTDKNALDFVHTQDKRHLFIWFGSRF